MRGQLIETLKTERISPGAECDDDPEQSASDCSQWDMRRD